MLYVCNTRMYGILIMRLFEVYSSWGSQNCLEYLGSYLLPAILELGWRVFDVETIKTMWPVGKRLDKKSSMFSVRTLATRRPSTLPSWRLVKFYKSLDFKMRN